MLACDRNYFLVYTDDIIIYYWIRAGASIKNDLIYGSTSSKFALADVRPIVGPGRLYFVERDLEDQVDHLCKVLFDQ